MADDYTTNAGAGGNTYSSDEIAGVHHPRVKIQVGADGTATDVSTSDPLPVSDAGGSLTVDGTVAVSGTTAVSAASLPLPTGAATETSVAATASAAGTTADAEATANGSIIAVLKRLRTLLSGGLPAALGANGGLKIEGVSSGTVVPVSDGGGSLTVDGTVGVSGTVATTLSGSPTVDTELTTADLDTGAGTDTRAVVGLALAASGGALLVGSANPVPVSDNAGSLTVDNAGTFAVQATLQAGSSAVGKLAANDGVDIGDVTINNASGAAAVNVQDGGNSLTVDGTVTANAGTGTMAVSNTVLSVVGGGVEATAQRVTIANDSTGVLSVDDNGGSLTVDGTVAVSGTVAVTDNSGSLTVDNGGTFAVQDSQVVADNAGFTDGTTKVFMGGFIYDEVAGTALTENDAAAARVNVNRAQVGVIEDGSTRGRYATVSASNALKVDGSAVTQPVSGTVTANPASGTITTVGTVTTLTGGGVAHAAADSGNPVKVGGRARTSDITAAANDNRTDLITDALGKLLVTPYASPENLISGGTVGTPLTTNTTASMIAAQGAGVRTYITSLTVTNAHATVGTVVQIRDGSGGTVLWEGYCAPAGGGAAPTLVTPLRGSANTAVHAVCVTTGASVSVSLSGYKAAL